MRNKKTDTIQGFLSPTKLLSGGSKNSKFNSKMNNASFNSPLYKMQQRSERKNNSQNQSYLNTSRQIDNPLQFKNQTNYSRLTGQNQRISLIQPGVDKRYLSEKNIPFNFDRELGNVSNRPYKKIPLQITEQQQIFNKKERTLQQINNRKWQTQKTNGIQAWSNQQKLKNDPTANFRQNFSVSKSSLTEGIKSGNSQVMTIQCYELIRKLSKIKQNLELQIRQLQTLLDNTSKYMDNMDEQFDKIKDKILSYTARCLDTAFTEYKQSTIEWQKYEDFERTSLTMLSQINEYIYNEQHKLSNIKNYSYRQITATAQQFERKIQQYRQFTDNIKKIRQQCIGMRPTLSQDRIKQFEKGLAILCCF